MRRALRVLGVLLAAAVLAALAALGWLGWSEAGLRWALAQAENASAGRLRVAGAQGTLAHGVRIERVAYSDDGLDVQAEDVRTALDALALLRGAIGLEPLHVESLRIVLAEGAAPRERAAPLLPVRLRIGQLNVPRLELQQGTRRHVITNLRASYLAAGPSALRARGALERPDARYPAALDFEVNGTLRRLAVALQGTVASVPVKAKLELAPGESMPLRTIEASAGPVGSARFDAALPRAEVSATVRARATEAGFAGEAALRNAAAGPLDDARLPIASVIGRFSTQGVERVAFETLRLELPGGGVLEGRGEATPRGARGTLDVRALDLRAIRSDLRRTALHGRLDVVYGEDEQSLSGRLEQDDVLVEAQVLREGGSLEVRALRARATGGEIEGTGRVQLAVPYALQAQLRLRDVNPAAFGDYPQASLNGRLEASGVVGEALRIDARWAAEQSTLLARPFESRGQARFTRTRISDAGIEARLGPVRATLRGALGERGDRAAFTLTVPELDALDAELSGRLNARGALEGSWSDPAVTATVSIEELVLPGDDTARRLRASVQGTRGDHEATIAVSSPESQLEARLAGRWVDPLGWEGELRSLTNAGPYPLQLLAPATLAVSRERFSLGPLAARVGKTGRLRAQPTEWQPGQLRTSGEFTGLPARWLALAAGVGERVRATLLVDGDWTLAAAPAPRGVVRVRRATGDVVLVMENEPVALELGDARLEATLGEDGLILDADVASRYGRLALKGDVGHAPDSGARRFGPGSPVALEARFEAAALRALAQPYLTQARVDGALHVDARVAGTLGAPRFDGALRGERLSFEMPPYGVHLRNGRLLARLEGESLRVEEFSIQGGAGRFTASGRLPLRFVDGGAKLSWSAQGLSVLERPDLRLVVSGEGEAGFDGRRLALAGSVRADNGRLQLSRDRLPQLGEDVVVAGRAPRASASQAPLPLALDVQLDMGEDLNIFAEGLEGRLVGRLRFVGGEDGVLRAFGRLRLVNATYYAFGRALEIAPGELIFDGPLDNPGLNVTAWRRNQAVEAGVQITGNVQSPRVQLVSNPPTPEAERLSWLVLGRATGEATTADLGLVQAAAGALLGRGDRLPLDRRLARAVGLDEVTVRGSGVVEERVVAFGKRLSDRLYVTYEQGVGTLASNLVKLDYSLGKRWSLRAETGTTSGAGLFYRFAWD